MHRAAAATIPMTIPVVLLDSRTTSEGPGTRLTPGSVGSAVGILRNIGEIINGPLSLLLSTSKDVDNGSNARSGWLLSGNHFAGRLFGRSTVEGCGGGRGGGGAALVGG